MNISRRSLFGGLVASLALPLSFAKASPLNGALLRLGGVGIGGNAMREQPIISTSTTTGEVVTIGGVGQYVEAHPSFKAVLGERMYLGGRTFEVVHVEIASPNARLWLRESHS
jgi:hypothetical protein